MATTTKPRIPFSILGTRPDVHITFVKEHEEYQWYGVFKPDSIIEDASKHLSQNTDMDLSQAKSILASFIHRAAEDYKAEKRETRGADFSGEDIATWFTIRMSKPTDEFTNTPRWHRDGRMYDADREEEVNSKYALILLGNPTRALEETEVVRRVVTDDNTLSEKELIEGLAKEPLIKVQMNDIIKFSFGQDDSPVHSEPDMSTDRVFVSVLFGSEKELKCMCEWREEAYRE